MHSFHLMCLISMRKWFSIESKFKNSKLCSLLWGDTVHSCEKIDSTKPSFKCWYCILFRVSANSCYTYKHISCLVKTQNRNIIILIFIINECACAIENIRIFFFNRFILKLNSSNILRWNAHINAYRVLNNYDRSETN